MNKWTDDGRKFTNDEKNQMLEAVSKNKTEFVSFHPPLNSNTA